MKSVVWVEWIDATQDISHSWLSMDATDGDPTEEMLCWSAGFVLRETDEYVWLAHTVSGDDTSPFIVIPKTLIKRRAGLVTPAREGST